MVREIDPSDGASGHAGDRGSGPALILDRIAARALHASGFRLAGNAPAWSEEAKDRLYRRMFPDSLPAGRISDAPVPAMP